MKTIDVDGHAIEYDETGAGPSLLLLSGWCQDHRLFDQVVERLAQHHRVVRVNWRGHGRDRAVAGDFGVAEQATDVIAVLDALGIDRVVPVSTSHGGWAAVEIAERLGVARVPRFLVIDWIMVEAPPAFVADLQAIQDPKRWLEGRRNLFDAWLDASDHPAVEHHVEQEMGSFDFDMWARACRVIEQSYATFGSPLQRMAQLSPPRPVLHLYSHPRDPAYDAAQRRFAAEHPWFAHERLGGPTHFPTLDSAELVAARIGQFARSDG